MTMQYTTGPGAVRVNKNSGGSGCLWVGLNLLFLLFLVIGGWYGYRSYSLVKDGGVADGSVVSLEEHRDDDGSTYAPVVEFQVGGQRYQMTGSSASSPPAYHVGQKVRVRYDRADPTLARIDNFWELWLLPLIFIPIALIFGLVFNVVMLVGLVRRRR